MLEAAGRDERLATGQLYLDAKAEIERLMRENAEKEAAFASCSRERMGIAMDRQRLRAALEESQTTREKAPQQAWKPKWPEAFAYAVTWAFAFMVCAIASCVSHV
jgi:hypothetical protein